MIEVELRGHLTKEQFENLETFLKEYGSFKEFQDREMFLLYDYAGYSKDFTTRDTDIRLRNTNGNCEIMMKRKIGDDTTARKEISVPLKDTKLDNVKEVMKALGCGKALWMHRVKNTYMYEGSEWSCISAPNENGEHIYFYEVEREVVSVQEVEHTKEMLKSQSRALDLPVLQGDGARAFIHLLDTQVNKVVEL